MTVDAAADLRSTRTIETVAGSSPAACLFGVVRDRHHIEIPDQCLSERLKDSTTVGLAPPARGLRTPFRMARLARRVNVGAMWRCC
jgi:hypothetical protein